MKKSNIISLSKIINSKIKRKINWFQPIFELKIKNKNYIFWIPFVFQILDKKSNVSFSVSSLNGYFPHFKSLDNEKYSLNSWYNNILDITKTVNKEKTKNLIVNLLNIKNVNEDLISKWFLILKNSLLSDISNDFLLDDLSLNIEIERNKELSTEEVDEIRKNIWIDNFKTVTIDELIEFANNNWIIIPNEPNKSYFSQVATEIAIIEKIEKRTVTQKDKDLICNKIIKMTNDIKNNII